MQQSEILIYDGDGPIRSLSEDFPARAYQHFEDTRYGPPPPRSGAFGFLLIAGTVIVVALITFSAVYFSRAHLGTMSGLTQLKTTIANTTH